MADEWKAWAISTHAPRTGSDMFPVSQPRASTDFNPRSPHGERPVGSYATPEEAEFQPTLPARGATARRQWQRIHKAISTHAPRTGSDCCGWFRKDLSQDFNPRSPHGERLIGLGVTGFLLSFQPTLPARGAT